MTHQPYAFPVAWPEPNAPEPGMFLRDWFAGQALVGINSRVPLKAEVAASVAYEMADAMMKQRLKEYP